MTTRVKTTDAAAALNSILREQATTAAGNNALISKQEEKNLDPVLQKASTALRQEGGKGTRVRVDEAVDRATKDSVAVWGRFNAGNVGRDGVWLSNDEVKAVKQHDAALGALTEQAMLRVRRGAVSSTTPTPSPAALDTATGMQFLKNIDYDSGFTLPRGQRLDVRSWHSFTAATRSTVPQQVLAAYDHYARAEQADWAGVRLVKGEVQGTPVYAMFMSTDGDDQFVELFDAQGNGIASAKRWEDGTFAPDAYFGAARMSSTLRNLDDARREDGLSEARDRSAAGQVPHTWRGDRVIDHAELTIDDYHHLTKIDLPTLPHKQLELATAALELVADRVLRFRVVGSGSNSARLGDRENGVLVIGDFVRKDGQTYETAYWKDIDDSSYVFYFQRDAAGQLKLKHDQFDN